MNLRKPLVVAATVSALVVSAALPASADGTSTTFELTGGSLVLSVQATAALTNAATGTTTINGNLGVVSVTDERGGTATWNVSGASTAFTGAIVSGGSSSTAVSYTGGTVTTTGTITVAAGTAKTLTGVAASVVSPSSLSGNNTATWTPALAVTMPASALADTYTGVVTTSIV